MVVQILIVAHFGLRSEPVGRNCDDLQEEHVEGVA